ncbi:trigger factor [Buchnera aphidicola]|uniref:trigger factor n=1 Tax=Buchnera aphidicola TaxID=9 RepID=UPI003463F7B2
MKCVIQETKDFEKKIIVTIPIKKIQNIEKQEIIKIRKKTIINGFRKNKIPINIIKNKYQDIIQKNIFNNVINNNIQYILQKNNINAIHPPKVNILQYKEKSDLIYEINVQYIPKINLEKLKFITIHDVCIPINKNNISHYIEYMRKKHKIWNVNNQKIKQNNRITLLCKINITKKKKKCYENTFEYQFIIGKNIILEDIEKEILKKKIHENFCTTIHIPKKHPDCQLQLQDVPIKIYIKNVESSQTVYSTEHFIQTINKQNQIKSQKEFINFIEIQFKKYIKYLKNKYLNQQILKSLTKSNIIAIPENILQEKSKIFQDNMEQKYIKNQGNILEKKYYSNIKNQEQKKFTFELIIQAIIYQNQLQVTNNEIQKYMKDNNINLKFFNSKNIQHKYLELLQNIQDNILENKIQKYLLQVCTIQPKTFDLPEILNYLYQK